MSDSDDPERGGALLRGLSGEEIELLRARAARYALRLDAPTSDRFEVVIFTRGSSRYAAVIDSLREIRPTKRLSPVPGASPSIAGVFHYRGEILGLHDLQGFVRGERASDVPAWTLVLEHDGERLGLAADDVVGVESVSAASLQPTLVTLGDAATCFQGLLEGGALLLQTARLFSTPAFFAAF